MSDPTDTGLNSTSDIRTVVVVGVIAVVAIDLLFELFRYLVPGIYELRRYIASLDVRDFNGNPIPAPEVTSKWPLMWLKAVYKLHERDLRETEDLDTIMFLVSLKFGAIIFSVLTFLLLTILAPIYATGSNKNLPYNNPQYVQGIDIISLSNLPQDDPRIYATVAFDFVTAFVVAFALSMGYKKYAQYRARYFASANPANYAVLLEKIPIEFDSVKEIATLFEMIWPKTLAEVHMVYYTPEVDKEKKEYDKCVKERDYIEYQLSQEADQSLARKAFDLKRKEIYHVRQVELKKREEQYTTGNAFIVFKDKITASTAVQTQLWFRNREFQIQNAPEPSGINWAGMSTNHAVAPLLRVFVALFLFLMLTLWAFIITFTQGLANIRQLSTVSGFQWTSFLLDLPSAMITFIELFAPALLLMLINALIPIIMRALVSIQRLVSLNQIDRRTRNYSFAFYVMTSFFFVTVSGSIITQIQFILDGGDFFTLVAQTVPTQAKFMMTFIASQAAITFPLLLIQLPRILYRPFTRIICGHKTPRQRYNLNKFMSMFPYYKFYALASCHALIALVYSTMAPLICAFITVYMILAYFCMKYCLVFCYFHPSSGGGSHFRGFFQHMYIALYIKTGTMIALFTITTQYVPAFLELLLLPCLIASNVFIWYRYDRVARHGSVAYTVLEKQDEEFPERYKNMYESPGLRSFPYRSGAPFEPRSDMLHQREIGFESESSFDDSEYT